MKRLEKLIKANRYFSLFRLMDFPDIHIVMAVETGDATTKLARLSGDQVLIAYPELKQDGDSDSYTTAISGAVFVLAKITPAGTTPETEAATFSRLLELTTAILDRISADTCRGCDLLSGMALQSVVLTPESSIFGGWSGWSIDFTLK